eukprot:EG_transcript_11507
MTSPPTSGLAEAAPPLTRAEVRALAEAYGRCRAGLGTPAALRDFLTGVGYPLPGPAVEAAAAAVGHELSPRASPSFDTLVRLVALVKHWFAPAAPQDEGLAGLVDALAALDPAHAPTGGVAVAAIRAALEGYGLEVDLQQLGLPPEEPSDAGTVAVAPVAGVAALLADPQPPRRRRRRRASRTVDVAPGPLLALHASPLHSPLRTPPAEHAEEEAPEPPEAGPVAAGTAAEAGLVPAVPPEIRAVTSSASPRGAAQPSASTEALFALWERSCTTPSSAAGDLEDPAGEEADAAQRLRGQLHTIARAHALRSPSPPRGPARGKEYTLVLGPSGPEYDPLPAVKRDVQQRPSEHRNSLLGRIHAVFATDPVRSGGPEVAGLAPGGGAASDVPAPLVPCGPAVGDLAPSAIPLPVSVSLYPQWATWKSDFGAPFLPVAGKACPGLAASMPSAL